jgi:hypothetical protein
MEVPVPVSVTFHAGDHAPAVKTDTGVHDVELVRTFEASTV